MSQTNEGLFIFRDPGETGVRPLYYLRDKVLQLATLLTDSGSFDVVFVDTVTMYVKSSNERAVLSVGFRTARKNRRGLAVYLSGTAEMFELNPETNGGEESLRANLFQLMDKQRYGKLVLADELGEKGSSQIHLEHCGALLFDGSGQPPVNDTYLSSAVAYIEAVYNIVLRRDGDLEDLLVDKEPIYRPVESWVERLRSGQLKPPERQPDGNIAKGL